MSLCGCFLPDWPFKFRLGKVATCYEMDGLHPGVNISLWVSVAYNSLHFVIDILWKTPIWKSDLDTISSGGPVSNEKFKLTRACKLLFLLVSEQGRLGRIIWKDIIREGWIWSSGELFSIITLCFIAVFYITHVNRDKRLTGEVKRTRYA